MTPTRIACLGLITSAAGFVGMFRNLAVAVAPVAAINNYLLPLWMIIFGVVLLRIQLADDGAGSSAGS